MITVQHDNRNRPNMKLKHSLRVARWSMVGSLLMAVLALLPGCKGTPTKGEAQARRQAQEIAQRYRPGGRQPALPTLTTNSSLGDFLTYALLNQPSVEAAYDDWLASIERITTARSLPDPQLTFQTDIQNALTSIMPGLMMLFPGAGKLRASAEVASAESQARYFAFQTASLQSASEVKRAYYQLHFLDEKLRVTRENGRLAADLEQLARAQNEVGKVTLQDVLRAQIERDRLATEITDLEDSRSALLARFKTTLGLGSEAPPPPIPQHFEFTPANLSFETMFQTALTNNTTLRSLEAEVRSAHASVLLAQKARRPDGSLGLMADAKMSPVLYRPQASLSLPVWRDKLAAQIAEARANQGAAQARLSDEQLNLAAAFAEQSFLYREAERSLELLNDRLLPKARQSLEIARMGYLSGQIDFFNVNDAERTLVAFELDHIEAATQRELALVEISLLVQGLPPSRAGMAPPKTGVRTSGARGSRKMGGGM